MDTEIKARPNLEIIKEENIPHLLFPGEVGAVLELTVRDKDGKVTERQEMKSESFVRQFLEMLWITAYPINEYLAYELTDTGGDSRWIPQSAYNLAADGPINDITYGVVVGTDIPHAAVTIDDYQLVSQIVNATMNHSAVTFGAPASDATTSQFTITRNFANVSGGAVLVAEIGLYIRGWRSDTYYRFMAIRDIVSINVPDGQTLTVNYRVQAVV